jgi:two-component system sensor histidine kinase KdpD
MSRLVEKSERWAWSALVVAICTVCARLLLPVLEAANVAMLYLLAVVFVATRFGRAATIFASILGVGAFDFFCVPPYFTLRVDDARYLVMFVVMLVVGVVIGTLTDRLRVREQEAQKTKTAIEIERQRNALLSVVSHDLRTPLAAITGAATAILDAEGLVDSSTQRELVRTIADEAQRLDRLVGNLLEMTRLESGTVKLKREWQPIEEPIGAALSRLEGALGERKVRLDVASDLPIVAIDGSLVEQVVTNLVENAIKYAPPSSPIEIRASADRDVMTIEVADRGPGIAEEERFRVFEKFRRGNARKDRWGTGLGLAICRAIVEAHGGRIVADGRDGGGASMRFTLPLADAPRDAPTVATHVEAP